MVELGGPATLAELMDGLLPHVDPTRDVTGVEVDGRPFDPTDAAALAALRLAGSEQVRVVTETPAEFARSRRIALGEHLAHVRRVLDGAVQALRAGDATGGNRLLAVGSRDLGLVLELDRNLAVLDAGAARCAAIVGALEGCGERMTAASRAERWDELATILEQELLPVIVACLPA
jgi:hypothetical protein